MDDLEKYISFTLLGEKFTIKSDVPKEYFLKLVDFFERRNTEIKTKLPNLSNLRLAILSALDIIDELFRVNNNMKENTLDKSTAKLIYDLSESLASVIDEDSVDNTDT